MAEHRISEASIRIYIRYLQQEERSASTIEKYGRDLHRFAAWLETRESKTVSKAVVVVYKSELSTRYSPASVNCMLAALNGFFSYMGWNECRVKPLRVQRLLYGDPGRELSRAEYIRLVEAAKARKDERLALLMQTLCGLGLRVIEASLKQASGKYFRTLDCDDWFEEGALAKFIRFLATCDTDIVYTDYKTVQGSSTLQTYPVSTGREPGRQYTFESLYGADLCMEMHAMTFRTEMLRQADLTLPHHCHYTDMLYTFLGVQASRTLCFVPMILYCYRLGRDGQSVSLESYRKHFDNYEKVVTLIAEQAPKRESAEAKDQLLMRCARDVMQNGIQICLRQPCSRAMQRTLKEYDKCLLRHNPEIANLMQNKNTRLLRISFYWLYPLLSWWEKRK